MPVVTQFACVSLAWNHCELHCEYFRIVQIDSTTVFGVRSWPVGSALAPLIVVNRTVGKCGGCLLHEARIITANMAGDAYRAATSSLCSKSFVLQGSSCNICHLCLLARRTGLASVVFGILVWAIATGPV